MSGAWIASRPVLAILNISRGYQILGLLHVLAVIAAFGPLFIYPSMQRAGAGQAVARLHLRLALPAMTLVWVFGMGLVGLGDPDVGELVPDPPGTDGHQRDGAQPDVGRHRDHPPVDGGDPLPDDLQAGDLTRPPLSA